ncbi:hypothetical protein V8E53_005886 [Lactarius tabidus]
MIPIRVEASATRAASACSLATSTRRFHVLPLIRFMHCWRSVDDYTLYTPKACTTLPHAVLLYATQGVQWLAVHKSSSSLRGLLIPLRHPAFPSDLNPMEKTLNFGRLFHLLRDPIRSPCLPNQTILRSTSLRLFRPSPTENRPQNCHLDLVGKNFCLFRQAYPRRHLRYISMAQGGGIGRSPNEKRPGNHYPSPVAQTIHLPRALYPGQLLWIHTT